MTIKNKELVIWFTEVVAKYILHMADPKGHFLNAVVVIRNGIPSKKNSSANARLRIYVLVTVCIFENLNTT